MSDDFVCALCGGPTIVLGTAYRTCAGGGREFASVDTHPKDGDAKQAPLVSGAVPKADAHD